MVRYRHMRESLGLNVLVALIGPAATSIALAQDNTPQRDPRLADMPIVPVHDEPHHRQLFQFGPTRVLELQIPPNDISWYHVHEWPVLYLTLSSSRSRTVNLGDDPNAGRGGPPPAGGGAARAGGPPPGGARAGGPPGRGRAGGAFAGPAGGSEAAPQGPRAFSSTSYIERPVTHFVENLGTGLFRAMVVVNETLGDPDDSVDSFGFLGEPELTNPWFRSYRVTLEPGEGTDDHSHTNPVVILQATDGKGRSQGPMDWEFNEPGQWAFYDAGVGHGIRNEGSEPIELLEIEVRVAP